MEHKWQSEVKLPPSESSDLAVFVEEVVEVVKEEGLDAVILYGSAAKDDYCEQTSDINVMLAFREISMNTLDALAPVIQEGKRKFRLSTMLVSQHDLERSTDVFPIKFLDIQEHHTLLWGKDVLQDIKVEESHLRLRCEQEFKNLAMRLRAFYLQRMKRAERIEQTLTHTFSSFLIGLDTLLYLQKGKHAVTKAAIIEESQEILDTDIALLHKLHKLKKGELEADMGTLKTMYGGLLTLVNCAADRADALE